jgi:hypothetical protein
MNDGFPGSVFSLKSSDQFLTAALEIFNFQAGNNQVYNEFLNNLGRNSSLVKNIYSIPFLPVEFFKSRKIISGDISIETVFESSRTSGVISSKHYVHDLNLYQTSFIKSFRLFAGKPSDYLIAALLPSYLERNNSSLVYMMNCLINESRVAGSGFYGNDPVKLLDILEKAKSEEKKILLFGVSFALLDLAEKYSPDLSGVIVMETGGMKGKRKEVTRQELHSILKQKLNIEKIFSEYGMTELLSQAYSHGDGIFHSPPWMKILIRDPQDPLTVTDEPGVTGGINIIDLANYYSCSFIATGDLGRIHEDGGFEILGRFDNSDIRGCNLMAE